ncbi:hypothetical protein KIN20_005217 [Parelaphostrongylus tenuis]|uniref:Uncharacterized protein n=1 Tax=Parelaphostrongylus tenuis TaxID=148309 RepID=A0AAD5M476_PARTN|nr:hypothetical protein KIN20_005217 [Parelaphostrongylus tenuis]
MKILTNIKRLPIELTLISLLATFSTVLGCGVMPAGQVSTRTFNVSGFTTLPVNMVYAGKLEISIRVPGIAANSRSAQAFVERLVMQTVFDVLESQARTALLPDAVISLILSHLTVKVSYTPMQCQTILSSPTDMTEIGDMPQNCIIVGNTVTGICPKVEKGAQNDDKKCMKKKNVPMGIPGEHLTITGTLSTTNVVMANWSQANWQNVLNRAIRILASGSYGLHFFSATATVGGN